jgi:hypothetical protein
VKETIIMSDELVKKADQPIDNFDGYEDATEGEEEQSGSLLVGERVKFTNNAMWMVGDDELPEGLELILIDVLRVLVKWGRDQKPIKDATHILAAGEKWPDIEALNNKCPQNEWREGPDGKMQGPYQAQRVVYLLDPKTMTRYTWPPPPLAVASPSAT